MEVKVFRKTGSFLQLLSAYMRFNLKAQLEYRGAFIAQALAMFFNNSVWLTFWTFFFARFPIVRGWHLSDVITMWAVVSSAYGLMHTVFGNGSFLPTLISKGQLDVWMLYPRNLVSHFMMGKMSATAVGDFLFGFVAYVVFVSHQPERIMLFALLVISGAVVFFGFDILTGSLGFYVRNAERLSEEWRFSLITFGTYPEALFHGNIRVLLYTLIPAGLIGYLPVAALHELSFTKALVCLAAGMVFTFLAMIVFHHGLGRYESGNLMEMRG
jgi:ABC-2 type transport system permease protein